MEALQIPISVNTSQKSRMQNVFDMSTDTFWSEPKQWYGLIVSHGYDEMPQRHYVYQETQRKRIVTGQQYSDCSSDYKTMTCLNSFVFPYTHTSHVCLWKAVLILSGLSDSCYFHLCFPWVAGACIDTGGKASLGAFLPAGGTAPLLPAETDHLWAAGEEQPAEHRDGQSAAKDRGASAGQDPPAAWYIHYVEASLYSICDSCVWTRGRIYDI